MDIALLAVRLILATVLGLASLTKLADRTEWQQALRDFGVPTVLAPSLGLLLPLTELAVAVALLPAATAWWAACSALVLLVIFITGMGINLARGRQPHCHCFGQLSSAPIGWPTLARNVVLAAAAAFLVRQGRADIGPSAVSWLGELSLNQAVGLVGGVLVLGLLALDGWFLVLLLRQNGSLLLRVEALEARLAPNGAMLTPTRNGVATQPMAGLQLGGLAPAFHLVGLDGESVTLEDLRAPGKPAMLIFSDSNCGACMALLPEIARWQRDYATALTVALISRGTPEANRVNSAEYGVSYVLLQQNYEVAEAYQVAGMPSAVLVHPDGTIGSPLVVGADAIRALVAHTLKLPAPTSANGPCPRCGQHHGNGTDTASMNSQGGRVGDSAPVLKLPDLADNIIDLADFRGSSTLVLFWNPHCGFCQQMLPDLKAWEVDPPEEAPKLLIVSTGSVEDIQAMDLRSPVVLDQSFTAGQAFGANGTPMAVLVDAQGKIASDVAAGGTAVMALISGHGRFNPLSA